MVESVDAEASDLAHDLNLIFLERDYVWTENDESYTPNPEQIENALRWMKDELGPHEAGTSVFGGRLIMHKQTSPDGIKYDVYVHFGDYDG